MLGVQIFLHSLQQVTGNIGMAVKVSWWYVLVLVAGSYTVILMVFSNSSQSEIGGMAVLLIFALLIFVIWGASLIAVVWHRFILLEEIPKAGIPYRPGLNIWTYFWYGVGVAIVLMVVGMVSGMVLGIVFRPDTTVKAIIFTLIISSIVVILFYRMALILPAVAINTKLGLGDAMQATRSALGPILVLAVAVVIFSTVLSEIVGFVFGGFTDGPMISIVNERVVFSGITGSGVIFSLADAAVQWFSFMLGISILSTLYGHFIEKRNLS